MEEKFMLIAARAEELAVLGSWTKVYVECLSPCGMAGRLTAEEIAMFRQSREYEVVQAIIADLRKERDNEHPMAVMTIRLPVAVHDALRRESHQHRTSLNKLCISKLLQSVDPNLVPSDIRTQQTAR